MTSVISKRAELEKIIQNWKDQGLRIGYVPTMGALHEGHISLVKRAREGADKIVVSIFVNPTQFAPNEDLDTYPRDLDGDLEKLKPAGTDLVYTPSVENMYPNGQTSEIRAGKAAEGLETDFRPHFFDGVVNIVARLSEHVRPDLAVFGEKDFQQLQVITEMVEALNLPIKIVGAPIIRDEHGLALSSRNAYLSATELESARQLNKILRSSTNNPEAALLNAGFDKIDYICERWNRRLAAAWVGQTRLIDNVEI